MPGYCHHVAPRRPNANCPHRPSQNEFRKRAIQVRNAPVFTALRRGKECEVRPNLISAIAKLHAMSRHNKLPLRHSDFKWFTISLIPAFSPRRRRIVRRLSENSRDWICRTAICKTRNVQQLFPLLGERTKGEGGRPNKIYSAGHSSQTEYRKRAITSAEFGLRIVELVGTNRRGVRHFCRRRGDEIHFDFDIQSETPHVVSYGL